MCLAILRHCCSRKLKVVGMTLYFDAAIMADDAMRQVAQEYGYEEGENYVYLGYKPGARRIILGMGEDISEPFPKNGSISSGWITQR